MGRGSDRLHTVWIPWADTPVELGGLVVLKGSASLPGFERMRNTYGEHDVDSTPIKNRCASLLSLTDSVAVALDDCVLHGAALNMYSACCSGWISTDSIELLQYDISAQWVTAKEFKMGDVVILRYGMIVCLMPKQ